MIFKFLIFILLLGVFGFLIFWLSQNSGLVTINFFDYDIEASFPTAVFLLTLFIIVLQIVIWGLQKFINIPNSLKNYIVDRKKEDLINILIKLLVATVDEDKKSVKKFAQRLGKIKSLEDIAILLEVSSADLETLDKARSFLEFFSGNKDYKIVALRHLIRIHISNNKLIESLTLINQLWNIQKSEWVAKMNLCVLIRLGDWEGALQFLEEEAKRFLSKEIYHTAFSIINYKLGESYMKVSDFQLAKEKFIIALRHNERFFPLIYNLIQTHIKLKEINKAQKLIKNYWTHFPNHIFGKLILSIAKEYTSEDFFDLINDIVTNSPSYEERLLLAKAALDSDQFDMAFKMISEGLSTAKNARACLLMAEFFLRTHGDHGEVLNWLKQAIDAQCDASELIYYIDFSHWQITQKESNDCVVITTLL